MGSGEAREGRNQRSLRARRGAGDLALVERVAAESAIDPELQVAGPNELIGRELYLVIYGREAIETVQNNLRTLVLPPYPVGELYLPKRSVTGAVASNSRSGVILGQPTAIYRGNGKQGAELVRALYAESTFVPETVVPVSAHDFILIGEIPDYEGKKFHVAMPSLRTSDRPRRIVAGRLISGKS
ncbi:MAG: hypothetical protein ABIA93_01190 [Candidatus Woesearchaeota archaeon]